ncbi:hypothetical protein [Corynebacterium terpenotabidum]|nr:hypothetical protein [Corynebacterium terpenotabidum]
MSDQERAWLAQSFVNRLIEQHGTEAEVRVYCEGWAGETTEEDVEAVVEILQGSWASLTWIEGGED